MSGENLSGNLQNSISNILEKTAQDPMSMLNGTIIIGFFVFIRILCLIRVIKDIQLRTKNTFFQILCIVLITLLTPILGLPIYLVIRPKTLYKDRLYRREYLDLQTTSCENCGMINNSNSLHCVNCGESIHIECPHCKKNYSYEYNHCPFCGASKNLKKVKKTK